MAKLESIRQQNVSGANSNKTSDYEEALSNDLNTLIKCRDRLCGDLIDKRCDIPTFCIQFDRIGKKFADNCFFASVKNLRK